jgi:putative PIG3 family NAD(P)H quinone oxidoreductase
VPAPAEGELLIRVAAAGVNRPDILQRMGGYPPPPGAPTIMGLEVAGEVVGVGQGVDQVQIGQPVCALLAGGGYAEYAVAPQGQCLPVPPALTLVKAAAMPETLFTVWTNLFERAYATEGDTVLVHGGTSGIGTMAIGLCGLFGIAIIVTVGSPGKARAALGLGATHAIDYNAEDFVERVRAITAGRGVAAVLDMVGGDYVARNLQCLADDGRHVSIAVQRGATDRIDAAPPRRGVQVAGRGRTGAHRLAACRGRAAEAGDRPDVSAGGSRGRASPDGVRRACRQDRADDVSRPATAC